MVQWKTFCGGLSRLSSTSPRSIRRLCCILRAVNRRFLRRPPSDSSSKPRVLIVDDHQRVIEAMSSILAEDFEIAGVATDGRQAVERAVGLEPDAVVLDIGMPGLDGFQTSRALQRAGSRAPIVFLSMYDGDDYVREAFRHGARTLHRRAIAPAGAGNGLVRRNGHLTPPAPPLA